MTHSPRAPANPVFVAPMSMSAALATITRFQTFPSVSEPVTPVTAVLPRTASRYPEAPTSSPGGRIRNTSSDKLPPMARSVPSIHM